MELLIFIIIVVILWNIKGPTVFDDSCTHMHMKRTGKCSKCGEFVQIFKATHVDDMPPKEAANFRAMEKQLRQDTIAKHKSRWN